MTSEAKMYQKMYHILTAAADGALFAIKNKDYQGAGEVLKKAMLEAEDVYILWEESEDQLVRREQALAWARKKAGITPDMSPEDIERMVWLKQQKNPDA